MASKPLMLRPHIRTRKPAESYHASAYVGIRQHTRAYGHGHLQRAIPLQHTSAYVSIRQHTSAYASIPVESDDAEIEGHRQHTPPAAPRYRIHSRHLHTAAYVSIRQHTSAYVSIQQPLAAPRYRIHSRHLHHFRGMRQHTSACVSIRRHTSAYVSIRHRIHWGHLSHFGGESLSRQHT
jgi:hypothetical protein